MKQEWLDEAEDFLARQGYEAESFPLSREEAVKVMAAFACKKIAEFMIPGA